MKSNQSQVDSAKLWWILNLNLTESYFLLNVMSIKRRYKQETWLNLEWL